MELLMAPWSYRGIRVRPDSKGKWLLNTTEISPIAEGERSKRGGEKALLKCNALSKSFLHFKTSSDLHSYASVHREILGRFPNEKGSSTTAQSCSTGAPPHTWLQLSNALFPWTNLFCGYFATLELLPVKAILGDFIQSPHCDTEN